MHEKQWKVIYILATQFLPYAWEIWNRSFIFPVRPTVHTNPSRKLTGGI